MKIYIETIPCGWINNLLDEIAERGSGHTPDKDIPEYWNGDIRWISLKDSNKLDRIYISDTEDKVSQKGIQHSSAVLHPAGVVVLSRDAGVGKSAITTREMAVSQHFVVWKCGQKLNNHYLYYWLQLMKPEFERIAVGSTIKTIGLPYFKKFRVVYPILMREQLEIVEIFTNWDHAIDLTTQLIEAKQQRKRGLMQQLLTGKKRFKHFINSKETQDTEIGPIPSDWLYTTISAIAHSVSERNVAGCDLPVLSCTKYQGLVDSMTYFGRKIFSDDTSTYKIVRRHQFAYATNHIEEGSIGYQDLYDEALISPMYTVFETKSNVEDRFIYALFKTEIYRQIFERSTSASVDRRGSLRWSEFSRIKVPLPSLPEQKCIAQVLDTCDQELALLNRKLALLKKQKQGLMQQLLTGKVRVKL
ncbi:MAG: restriction endonuclease subunit S [Chloroflexi bacterium]|nr:MAG: restriction endonuclease subunit S [Chloroflexota bacterium]